MDVPYDGHDGSRAHSGMCTSSTADSAASAARNSAADDIKDAFFPFDALPRDIKTRTLAMVCSVRGTDGDVRLRALLPATLCCRSWRSLAHALIESLTISPQTSTTADLGCLPRLTRVRFERGVRPDTARRLLLTLRTGVDARPAAASHPGSDSPPCRNGAHGRSDGYSVDRSGGADSGESSGSGGLQELLSTRSARAGAALSARALSPLPRALLSLRRLDVSLGYLGNLQVQSSEPCRQLAEALLQLVGLEDLRVRDAPVSNEDLAYALPQALALRTLAVEVVGREEVLAGGGG